MYIDEPQQEQPMISFEESARRAQALRQNQPPATTSGAYAAMLQRAHRGFESPLNPGTLEERAQRAQKTQ